MALQREYIHKLSSKFNANKSLQSKIIKVDIELHPLGGKQAWNLKTLVHIPTKVDIV